MRMIETVDEFDDYPEEDFTDEMIEDGPRSCPDCGRPNQFGEMCPACEREAQFND